MSESPKSILTGVDALINSHFFADDHSDGYSYKHKRSCIALSTAQPESFDGAALISGIYDCIEKNLYLRPDRAPSSENWKLRNTNDVKHDPENDSAEVTLERAIVKRWPKEWTYQMPVASGLFGSTSDKRRAVDLVCLSGNDCFDFVELKIKSNTPLHAAMEILGYGLVYLASRKDSAKNLKYGDGNSLSMMKAKAICLVALAPSQYYEKYKLDWLERSLNDGLIKLLKQKLVTNLKMTFRFEKFSDDFVWSPGFTPEMLPKKLVRERVYQ
jgi:hypothetical protein